MNSEEDSNDNSLEEMNFENQLQSAKKKKKISKSSSMNVKAGEEGPVQSKIKPLKLTRGTLLLCSVLECNSNFIITNYTRNTKGFISSHEIPVIISFL